MKKLNRLTCICLTLFLSSALELPSALGQRISQFTPGDNSLRTLLAPAGITSSPFNPPDEGLGTYVVNSGSGLDTGCTYRSGGPLIVQIPVPALVNPQEINADGTLKNPDKLVQAGIISAQAVIRFPVYDIDSDAQVSPPDAPEIDRLSFNGQFKKILSGVNNQWTDDSIVVPISEIRFQSPNSPSAVNELRVDIDTGNAAIGQELWCMAIDWVAIEFDAAAPYVLVHGIDADASTWDQANSPGVLSKLDASGVLYTRVSLTKNGTSAGNAIQLNTAIKNFLAPLKGDKINIIAHSKGGLDTQALQALGPPFTILSLSTISTPHLGTAAADLGMIQKSAADDKINAGNDPNGYASTYLGTITLWYGPKTPGLADLTTYAATAAIGAGLRGNINPTYTFGADADANQNNALDESEATGYPAAYYIAKRFWLVLRDFSSTVILSTTTKPGAFYGTRTVLTYSTILSSSPQANDAAVTINSANPSYGNPLGNYFANHGTIKNGVIIDKVLPLTIPLR
jgi:triacylglycerol lipase